MLSCQYDLLMLGGISLKTRGQQEEGKVTGEILVVNREAILVSQLSLLGSWLLGCYGKLHKRGTEGNCSLVFGCCESLEFGREQTSRIVCIVQFVERKHFWELQFSFYFHSVP